MQKAKQERVTLVTGGASGIGKAIAKGLSLDGHRVIIADRAGESAFVSAEEIGADFIACDLSCHDSCRALIDEALELHQGVDILVNNAGFQHVSPIEDFPEEKWSEMLEVMLTAPFLLTKYCWTSMREKGWGRIVNVASIHGVIASKHKSAYISAKHGLIGLTKASALEGGEHGITVNALCPAYVRTPLVENQISDLAKQNDISEERVVDEILLKSAAVKKLIEPEEIASIVSLLCSDQGASITGASWTVDGGWTAQ